jgi:hypothetical protein
VWERELEGGRVEKKEREEREEISTIAAQHAILQTLP